jgi:hypothetical protein
MELKQQRGYVVHRAWAKGLSTPRYDSFWDGYDYQMDFTTEADLVKVIEEHYGLDWQKTVEIHQIQILETRIK